MDEAAGQSAVMEVDLVDVHEEAVDHLIGPEAVHSQSNLIGAVRKSLVDPAGGAHMFFFLFN